MSLQPLFKYISAEVRRSIEEKVNKYKAIINAKNDEIKTLNEIINKHENGLLREGNRDIYRDAFMAALNNIKGSIHNYDCLFEFIKNNNARRLLFIYERYVLDLSIKEMSHKHGISRTRVSQIIWRWSTRLFDQDANKIIDELKRKDYLGMM